MADAATIASPPRLVSREVELRAFVEAARKEGRGVSLAPTMGALHEGHLSLVRAAVAEGGFTVVSIFVNPAQFGPGEDFARYPRDLQRDCTLLGAAGADLVFAPEASEMYPEGFSTWVDPADVAQPLEGVFRPGHFRGVATVVLKLLNLVGPNAAYFGQKDYQQSLVVRRLVRDLNVPVEIRVCPTVREADGLALSSRNAYLSPAEREQALAISRCLFEAAALHARGERKSHVLLARMRQMLAEAGIERIDYTALADPETLADIGELAGPAVALVAAHVGKTRLIDNVIIGG